MTKEDLLARRQLLRSEFDRLKWRKDRIAERMDQLAREIEECTGHIHVGMLRESVTLDILEAKPLVMELIEG